jgi:hypothetical protein
LLTFPQITRTVVEFGLQSLLQRPDAGTTYWMEMIGQQATHLLCLYLLTSWLPHMDGGPSLSFGGWTQALDVSIHITTHHQGVERMS